MKAFLGMGLLGSNFVRAMVKRGEQVQVWNRTASRAQELEPLGVRVLSSPAEAVQGAEIIHLTLKDDASVDEVLATAAGGLQPGAIIVDHTTTSKEGAIQRSITWKERGFHYQHAPVFMGPANALEGSGFMLLSGEASLIQKLEPDLAKMTGRLLHFGDAVGKAAAIKLAGNAFLVSLTFGLRDTLHLSQALGLSVDDLSTLFSSWNPGQSVNARLKRMTSGDLRQPSWELNMARKDMQLFMNAAAQNDRELSLMPVIAAIADEWIAKGYGHYDWTVVGRSEDEIK